MTGTDNEQVVGMSDGKLVSITEAQSTLGDVRGEIFSLICDNCEWLTERTDHVAADGFRDVLLDADPTMLPTLLFPLFKFSDYWPEQIVRAMLRLPGDDTGDLEHTRDLLVSFLSEKADRHGSESGAEAEAAAGNDLKEQS